MFQPRHFTDEDLQTWVDGGHADQLAFEWLKYVGTVAFQLCHVDPDSDGLRLVSKQESVMCRAMLSRCARLSLATLALAQEQKHGDVILVLTRCLTETAVRMMWMCRSDSAKRCAQLMSDSLRQDLHLEDLVVGNANGRDRTPLEARMLASIERCLASSELTRDDVRDSSRLPNFEQMLMGVGFGPEFYIVAQRIGSHAVHGTWTDLLLHHIDQEVFAVRTRPVRPRPEPLMSAAVILTYAFEDFVAFLFADEQARSSLSTMFSEVREEICRSVEAAIAASEEPSLPTNDQD